MNEKPGNDKVISEQLQDNLNVKQHHHNFWTNNAIVIFFEI